MMDATNDPYTYEVVIMCAAQLGKSETLNNIIGYYIDNDPCPILMLQPTVDMAQAYSKDRIAAGLIRSTPCLQDKEPRIPLGEDLRAGEGAGDSSRICHRR